MYIGGSVGLAHGYHHRPGLTADRFMPDPFAMDGSRMYRTGDLCQIDEAGVFEHLGRIDRQVKVRGLRIELAEIEAVVGEHPGVRSCSALVPESLDGRIAVFVVLNDGHTPVPDDIIEHTRPLLPAHMVPAVLVVLDQIPTNLNGKADEPALLLHLSRLPDRVDRPSVALTAPAGDLERRLLEQFCSVLGRTDVGVTDNFFRLGGHSLLVFKLIAASAEVLGVNLAVGDVFAAPSVRELAARIGTPQVRAAGPLVPMVPPQGRPLVVLVHGASGSILLRALGARLGKEYDVYGIEADLADGADQVETMAAEYVAAVDAVLGPRPLILVGWSIGGCVALEMARCWQERGIEAVATVLMDTWLPPAGIGEKFQEQLSAPLSMISTCWVTSRGSTIGQPAG